MRVSDMLGILNTAYFCSDDHRVKEQSFANTG